MLDKDQRVLLKLKSSEWIPSDGNEKPRDKFKKKLKKNLLLERYVENLQKKKLSKQDNRLLDVLGFQETLKILAEEEKNRQIKNQ